MNSEDTDNGKIRDRSAYDNHGNLQNGPTTGVPSPIGESYSFDGSDDYITTNAENIVSGQPELTLSAWVYTKSVPSGYPGIIVAQPNSSGNQIGIFQHNGNFYYELGTSGDVTNRINPGETVTTDTWTHVVLTWNGNKLKEYIDGSSTGKTDSTPSDPSDDMSNLNIGRWSGGPDYFDGDISDVRVYNRALSRSEITQLYNQRSNRTQKTKNFVKAELYEPGGRASDKQSLDSYYTDSNFVKARVHNRPHIYFGNSNQNAGFGSVNGYPPYFDGINKQNYSWRMRINFIAPESGTYEFGVDSDDASDVLIDGNAVATFYGGHGFDGDLRNHTGTIDLNQGNSYQLQARFQEGGGGDGIAVGWKKPSDSSFKKFPLKITNQSQIDI